MTITIFKTHYEAEEAVRRLQRDGFDMKKLSIVGKDFEADEQVIGFYNTGDRVKYWGKMGAFWGGLWGLLLGAAFLWVPGVGLVAVGGPIVAWLTGAVEMVAVAGGLSALGAALYGIGIPKDSVVTYETAIKAGKFMLVAHGTDDEVGRARELLRDAGAEESAIHHAAGAAAVDELAGAGAGGAGVSASARDPAPPAPAVLARAGPSVQSRHDFQI